MIRILHAADLHLDSPFEGLPAEKTAIRRREQRELLRTLPRLRSESGAQLVLLAGDVFDRGVAFAETEEALASAIAECAVPVVISPGNHDYYALGGRWDQVLTVFGGAALAAGLLGILTRALGAKEEDGFRGLFRRRRRREEG